MLTFRTSTPADEPQLRALWTTAFGDDGSYQDCFFQRYCTPERMLVIESEGTILAMTAWFPSTFQVSEGISYRCAYLYAVATLPAHRGQGLASQLLAYCDRHLVTLGFHGVTTVPAREDLHVFFGQNGFRECFTQTECTHIPTPTSGGALLPMTPEDYRSQREIFLADTPHVNWDLDGISYQYHINHLFGGGFYHLEGGEAILCVEGNSHDHIMVKEALGTSDAVERALNLLPTVCPDSQYLYRQPGGAWKFGMLKWFDSDFQWDWDSTAYLGFAFD